MIIYFWFNWLFWSVITTALFLSSYKTWLDKTCLMPKTESVALSILGLLSASIAAFPDIIKIRETRVEESQLIPFEIRKKVFDLGREYPDYYFSVSPKQNNK